MNTTYYLNQLDKLLPNIIDKYYLGYVLYFINKLKDRIEVSSQEIARSSINLFNAKTIGDVLRCFPIARRRTTREGQQVKLWNISDIRNICTQSYIAPINLEELNVAISGKKSDISPKIVQIPPIIDSFGEIHENVTEQNTIPFDERFVNPFKKYSDTKIKALDSKLNYDFSLSYKFYSSIISLLVPFFSDRWKEIGICLCVPKGYQRDDDKYPIINSRYMREVGLEGGDIRTLPSPRVHRTIAMVHQPMMDWTHHEAHHDCRIRDCCNPFHTEPGLRNLHQTLHNHIGDDHPLNQEIQPATPKEKPPTYWYDFINPKKNISYNEDMDIEWEGMNTYHKNRVLNSIKQTKH